jgi:ABC-type polysaccharide/polyol phosphate transport system ATPase subunit
MQDIAIEVKNISKQFVLRESRTDSLKESMLNLFRLKKREVKIFTALEDVSFNLYKGEALGIIGENGAGKSTLLRILSGISYPDKGEVNFYGLAVSILDIGAGFHPELTGRENVYLSAAIYNFSRQKINERYNEIIEFSGIGDFINEPVKNYSSGMFLRLAFAIITCLDADIFLIDEVINVGDANFQAKCKSKMQDLIAAGKTLLIASHNLNEMVSLCTRIISMKTGRIVEIGGTDVILKYVTRALPQHFSFKQNEFYHQKDLPVLCQAVNGLTMVNCGLSNYSKTLDGIDIAKPITIFFEYKLQVPDELAIRLKIFDITGVLVFICSSISCLENVTTTGNYRLEFEIPADIFNARMYSVDFSLIDNDNERLLLKVDKFLILKMVEEEKPGERKDYLPGIIKPGIKATLVKVSELQ